MNMDRRKELLEEYKNRKRDMGVISIKCVETGEQFLDAVTDVGVAFNSNRAKLRFNGHPNKRMQALWNQHGEDGFEMTVLKEYKPKDPLADHKAEVSKLREECLKELENASKVWR